MQGGALTAALGDVSTHDANVDVATWTFSTPAYDRMVGATLWRVGDADGGAGFNASYQLWLAGPSNENVFDECVYQSGCTAGVGDPAQPLDGVNRVPVPSANLGAHLYLNAGCGGNSEFQCPAGKGDGSGYAAAVNLYAADIVLEQTAGPTTTNVSGELASAPTVQGTDDLIFSASDPGAGVWEATFTVDGKVVQSTVPNENGGRCRNVGQTTDGLPAFLYLQPCLASESVDVPFNTTAVPNGLHHLLVTVVDPAGNSAPVLDRQINVENPVPPTAPGSSGTHGSTRHPRARLTLHIEPHRLSIRRSIHFSGHLLGGSIPKAGKLLVLEARQPRAGTSRRRQSGGTSYLTWAQPSRQQMAEVRHRPHRRPGEVQRYLPLPVPRLGALRTPSPLRSGGGLSVRQRELECGAGAGVLMVVETVKGSFDQAANPLPQNTAPIRPRPIPQ